MLPSEVKAPFMTATKALKQRLYPLQNEALLSVQLMKRRQGTTESVDEYAQDLEALFKNSYWHRARMDEASKGMLKCDLFVQGLMLKWQENVLPSATSFQMHCIWLGLLKSRQSNSRRCIGPLASGPKSGGLHGGATPDSQIRNEATKTPEQTDQG